MSTENKDELIQRFQEFVKGISKEDKIALCFHRDADGICSALNVARALEKLCGNKPVLFLALDYSDLKEGSEKISECKPDKIIAVDLGLDSFEERFKGFAESCKEMLFIDHHKLYNDFNSEKVVFIKAQMLEDKIDPSQYPVSKLTFDLFSEIVDISENDWLACIGILGDRGFETWKEFIEKVMQEKNFSKDELDSAMEIVNAVETVAQEKFISLFEFLFKAKDIHEFLESDFSSFRKKLHEEADKFIESFEEKAEYFPELELYLFEIEPKYNVKSFVVNQLSIKYPEKTLIVLQYISGEERIWFSARRQDFKVKMNELLENAVQGIPNSSGGGHIPAAAGSIPKEFREQFKENVKKILKSP